MDAPNEMPSLLRYFWLGLYSVCMFCVFVCLKFVGVIVLLLFALFVWSCSVLALLVGWIRTPSWRDSTEIGARSMFFVAALVRRPSCVARRVALFTWRSRPRKSCSSLLKSSATPLEVTRTIVDITDYFSLSK